MSKPQPKLIPPPSRSPGRPAFEPTLEQRNTVKLMVAGGIQEDAIASVLGISQRTLQKAFRKEITNGQAEVNAVVIAAHLKRIRAGDMRAIEWWEKSRMGWVEKVIVDDPRANQPMRVVVELVGDAPPTIDHDPRPRAPYAGKNLVELIG